MIYGGVKKMAYPRPGLVLLYDGLAAAKLFKTLAFWLDTPIQ